MKTKVPEHWRWAKRLIPEHPNFSDLVGDYNRMLKIIEDYYWAADKAAGIKADAAATKLLREHGKLPGVSA